MGGLESSDQLSAIMFSFVAFVAGGYITFYGIPSFRKALFPFGFLLFAVPVPSPFFNWVIHLMQIGSAEVANSLLPITGTTYVRDGLTFHLTTMSVTVAEECSGIRGTMAILITAVIAGKLMLRSGWSRLAIALLVLPISFLKNGVRVATLAYLAGNVDTKFVTNSALHSDGGFIFFGLGLVVMFPLLWLLRVLEGKAPTSRTQPSLSRR
jgi:exosortase